MHVFLQTYMNAYRYIVLIRPRETCPDSKSSAPLPPSCTPLSDFCRRDGQPQGMGYRFWRVYRRFFEYRSLSSLPLSGLICGKKESRKQALLPFENTCICAAAVCVLVQRMYMYVYHIYIYTYMYIIHTHIYMHKHVHVHIYMCMYIYLYIHIYIHIYTYIYIYTYIHTYIYLHIYTHTHTHIHT